MDETEKLLGRVDTLLTQRNALLSRLPVDNVIKAGGADYDRFGALTSRIDFFRRWTDPHGRPTMRRVSVRISEISGGYSFTQFKNGGVSFTAFGPDFNGLPVYDRASLIS